MGKPLERQTLTVPEAAQIIGISRNHAYACVKTGKLPVIKLGKRFVIPIEILKKLLSGIVYEQ